EDVETTEISVALTLEYDSSNGNYIPKLDQQQVFAFLPLRDYGLKFIVQADFVLSSSREEVNKDSPWNKFLLSELPNLFVSAEQSFCSLPCFKENPAKGVSVFMSFVPLRGEVDGFFSQLPRKIISKLRNSKCLLLEGDNNEWVPPSNVLRNWTEETRSLLPESLIRELLGVGVGYLNKDTVLTDSLAQALHIEECGPKFLIRIMSSLCAGSLKSMGLSWISSWLNVLFLMSGNGNQAEVISSLYQLRFIPLVDGTYTSPQDGTIWLHTDLDPNHRFEAFGKLDTELRVVNPALLSDSNAENVSQMLYKVGVQRLSEHEVLKKRFLPAISNEIYLKENTGLITELLSFIMFHLETSCHECLVEKEYILSQLRNYAFISTNHGYKRLADVPIHFSKEFGNLIDVSKLVSGTDMNWFEIDKSYLKHAAYKSSPEATSKLKKFLQELGVTDFVKITKVEMCVEDMSHTILKNMMLDDCISPGATVTDYNSQELWHLLSHVSSKCDREKCEYLLKVLDTLWDDYSSDKLTAFCSTNGQYKPFKSYVIRILHGVRWLASSMDDQLHFPYELFHNCEAVHAVLGDNAPYCIPKVNNVKLLNDIGLKNTVHLDDALSVLEAWRRSEKPFRASISQMSKFYTYIWNEMSNSKQKILENLHSQAFIFVPCSFGSTNEVVSGLFLSPTEVYWHDSIVSSMEQAKSTHPQFGQPVTQRPFSKMLCNVYAGLQYFFVNEFGVAENPPLRSYLQLLLQLSTESSPSQASKTVFLVFQKWSDGLDSGVLSSDDVDYMKKIMEEKELKILPTVKNKWVSLHQSFGLICWCDDEELRKEFMNLNGIDFLRFGELTDLEKQMLQTKVSVLFQRLGIPSLSEVVTREAIADGLRDGSFKTSLVNWALPFTQRYIYSNHPNEYSRLKLSEFNNINSLKIVVVEKLFYKNVIKRYGNRITERLSATQYDNGAESTSEQTIQENPASTTTSVILEQDEALKDQSESGISTVSSETEVGFKDQPGYRKPDSFGRDTAKMRRDATERLIEIDGDWIIKEKPALTIPLVILEENKTSKEKLDSGVDTNGNDAGLVTPQHVITGRTGEEEAFKFFCAKPGEKTVTWVNEFSESGQPYDIVIEDKDNNKEYIEVKSTSKAKKDWFNITMNEWKFALEKGDSFSIACVVLLDGKPPKITVHENLLRKCQQGELQLGFRLDGKLPKITVYSSRKSTALCIYLVT
ncbi:histidine kinase-, DNA gyrase B-, and HSP90-like ATPase family protein, partial [Tanacetum coccineum]